MNKIVFFQLQIRGLSLIQVHKTRPFLYIRVVGITPTASPTVPARSENDLLTLGHRWVRYVDVTKTLYNRFEDVLWTLTMRQWHAGNTLGKWRTIVNVLRTHTKRMHNDSLKPQSHRIVRFCDRTIGCDLVSYDRSAMFAAISFYNRTLLCILYDWL